MKEKKKLNFKILIPAIAIVILAIVVILALTRKDSITLEGNTESSGIPLNIDNYSNYLDVAVRCYPGGEKNGIFYSRIESSAEISGVSTNFNYKDVELVIEVYGTYTPTEVIRFF